MNRHVLSFCCVLDSERELLHGSQLIVTIEGSAAGVVTGAQAPTRCENKNPECEEQVTTVCEEQAPTGCEEQKPIVCEEQAPTMCEE